MLGLFGVMTSSTTTLAWDQEDPVTVEGIVKDAQSGEELVGANIVQQNTQNGTVTNESGRFSLQLVPSGDPALVISYVGYQKKTVAVENYREGERLTISLVPGSILSDAVLVEALRVDEASPMTYSNFDRKEIQDKNVGKDVPYLIRHAPSVVTTSDAGAGIGYTGVRIRGVDPSRINVTINGIPLNDAESHGVFWVDIPDLAASVDNLQIQRGVGTSTNGAGAFGATMNLQTTTLRPEAYGAANTTVGSFNTQKYNVKVGSGLMQNGWQVDARLSKIVSEGYIDRASSDLKSYYLSGARYGDKSLLKLIAFSGVETTYQAWYGVPESKIDSDRTYNPAGMEKSVENPYDNQTDNYQQDHYQLHYSYQLSEQWTANASLHYTYGRGYYEEYKADEPLSVYTINPVQLGDTTVSTSDLIRRLWLDNHFYGTVFSTQYKNENNWTLTFGGGYNEYDGDHFGEVIWAEFAPKDNPELEYYDNNGFKTDFNLYAKANYYLTPQLNVYADAQIRTVTYDFLGKDIQEDNPGQQEVVNLRQHDRLDFFNPKVGLVYRLKPNQRMFTSFSVANKEPTRDEYVNSTLENLPSHETLYDLEMGYKVSLEQFYAGATLYYMHYNDQLVPTGEINEVGGVIRDNVPTSFRAGIELEGGASLTRHEGWKPGVQVSANATLSRNEIEEYTQYVTVYDPSFTPVTNSDEETVQRSFTYENSAIALSPSVITNGIVSLNWGNVTWDIINKYVSRQYLDNTETKANSLDPYWLTNTEVKYERSNVPMFQNIAVSFRVDNLFNELYSGNGYVFNYIIQDGSGNGTLFKDNYYYPQAERHYMLSLRFGF